MTIDFSKLNTLGEIKSVQENGKDVFNDEEKDLFTNNLIWKDLVNARKVGELLYKIKQAKAEKKKNFKLQEDLEKEESQGSRGSVAYRVLNVNGLVDDTIDYLVFLGRSDLPKDKTKRQEKINELQKEIDEKKLERANNNIALKPLERQFRRLVEDRDEVKKTLERRNGLSLLIKGGNPKIMYQGTEQELDKITVTVNDYSGTHLRDANPPKLSDSAEKILATAIGYLDKLEKKAKTLPYHYASKLEYFDKRKYQNRFSVFYRWNNVGYGLLKCLRKIGYDKLEKIIEVSGSSKKSDLKKTAKRIVDCIHWHEEIAGTKGYIYDVIGGKAVDTPKGWANKYDSWIQGLLQKKTDEYPYVPAVDWDAVFEFVMEVFPLSDFSDVKSSLVDKPYLNNTSSPLFIEKPDSAKGWEDYFFISGYAGAPPAGSGKSIKWYSEQPNTPNADTIKVQIKEGQESVSKSWDFNSLVPIWYHVMDAFYSFDTKTWKVDGNNVELCVAEDGLRNAQNQLRFCKTMRELIKQLDLSGDVDEFDELLISIADRAEKNISITKSPYYAISKDMVSFAGDFWKNIRDVWNEDYSEDRRKVLSNLIKRSESEVSIYDARIEGIQKEINNISGKNSLVQFEIDRRQLQIDALKQLDDIQEQPLAEKKESFNKIYSKKDSQNGKWTWEDIELMLAVLELIKTDMEPAGESYKDEGFEAKETEIRKISDEVQKIKGKLGRWESLVNSTPNRLPEEGIKELLELIKEGKTTLKLTDVSDWYQELENQIILSSYAADDWGKVKDAIDHPDKYKKDIPSDLDGNALNTAFGTSGISDDDIKLSEWKITSNFKQKADIEKFLKDYKKGSAGSGSLVEHLQHGDWGGTRGGEKFTGDFEDFVKKGPKFVIGAIKHYEWEHGKGSFANKPKDDSVTKAMETANGLEGTEADGKIIKVKEKWDTTKDAHIAQFLYKQAIGLSGKDLIKEHELVDKKQEDSPDKKGVFKEHMGKYWGWYAAAGLILLAGGAALFYFWDTVKGWFGSKDEDTDRDEENE